MDIEQYIRQAAQKRGYDPAAVMRIVMGEGGVKDPALRSRGYDPALGGQEQSYGPFQMNMHAGLGKRLLQERGVDVRDPANVYKGIDYALDRAGVEGWTPWLNTQNRLGYGKWTGLKQGAPAMAATPAGGPAPTSALAGMMAPTTTGAPQMFGDLIGQNKVATTSVGPLDFGAVAANLLNSAQERDARKADIDAAETARRVALFGGADGSGLWGLYA